MIFNNQSDTKKFAQDFAKSLQNNSIVLFKGGLGVGKTFLCREIIKILANDYTIEVTSPTFPILQTYKLQNTTIYHFDLYRIKIKEEILEIGIEEALRDNICLIEWPEIIEDMIVHLPHHTISLEMLEGDRRLCNVSYQ